MKMKGVGRYGPRCSRRFKDFYGEMLADDFQSRFLSPVVWKQWRDAELERIYSPNPYRAFIGRMKP